MVVPLLNADLVAEGYYDREKQPHKVMTPEEYAATPIKGWHEVCRDVDGFGGIGVRYLGDNHDRA
jgi:hypothetical protein